MNFEPGFLKSAHILITGQPGAGKTTLAKELASKLDLPLISLDGIKYKNGENGDTALAMEHLKKKHKESIVEGVQILGMPKSYLEQHEVYLIEEPLKELQHRLESRGYETSGGEMLQGSSDKNKIRKTIKEMASNVDNFKKRFLDYKSKEELKRKL